MRGERLSETLYFGLDHGRGVVADCVDDYNSARPHSALGYQTPAALSPNSPQRAIGCTNRKRSTERRRCFLAIGQLLTVGSGVRWMSVGGSELHHHALGLTQR